MGTAKAAPGGGHAWRFFRYGGFDQVRIDSGGDLRALPTLDQKLWAALSCPARGLEFDERTLALVDGDGDGRIRPPEILSALEWTLHHLKDPASLLKSSPSLPLAAIDDSTDEGAALLGAARRILANLGRPDADAITVDDITDEARIFAATPFNGDGIVPPEAADDEAGRKLIEDMVACVGGVPDCIGTVGVTAERVTAFFDGAAAFSAWWGRAEAASHRILPLGEGTADAAAALRAVRAKVDDYFLRCSLAGYDRRAAEWLNPPVVRYEAMAARTLASSSDDVDALPLARIEAGRPLPLEDGLNPGWSEDMERFRSLVVKPVLGERPTLDTASWNVVRARFAPYEEWLAAKEGAVVEKLGLPRVREILAGDGRAVLGALIERDMAFEPVAKAIASVERLVRFHRDLLTLLRNFVSFRDFYQPGRRAIFQAGTLYLDGRSCDLCIRVADVAKHASLAPLSGTYLVYCECTRRGGTEKMTIAAAVTAGDADNLMIGRNGVFYDRMGRDWDALIVRIVENPIGVRQAFWAPYKRIAKMVSEQVEKLVAARAKQVEDSAAVGLSDVASSAHEGKAPAAPFDVARFAGIFAAIGLAVGAIGTAVATIVTGFLGLAWWQMPLALVGIPLLVSGPSMIMAYLKLRRRNLGPLLDASGWAVNTRAMINVSFGQSLTSLAVLPPGATRSLRDPFADPRRSWFTWILVGVLLLAGVWAWRTGLVRAWMGRLCPPAAALETRP